MIGLGLSVITHGGFGGLAIAGPVAPVGTITAGAGDGEVVIDVTTLTATYGDAVVAGDGLGTEGVLEWWNSLDGWQTFADPEATGSDSVFVTELLWGRSATIYLRRRNAEGNAGPSLAASITIAGAQYELQDVVLDGVPVTIDGEQVVILVLS